MSFMSAASPSSSIRLRSTAIGGGRVSGPAPGAPKTFASEATT
jgi:hypothetical protein